MSTKKRKLHESKMDKNSKEAEPNESEKCRKNGFGAKVVGLLRTFHGKLASIFTSPTQKKARKMCGERSVGEMRENRAYSRRKRTSEEHSEEESVRKRRKLSSEVKPPELQLHSNTSDDILEANQATKGRKRSRSSKEDSEAERVKRFKGDKTGNEERQCPDEAKAGGLAGTVSSFNFTITKELGSGNFGKVVLAKHVTGKLMAIKVIPKDIASPSFVMSERRILEAAKDCPFLVHGYAAVQTEEEIMFMMEYIPGGTLEDLLEKRVALDIETTRNLAAEIVCGLTFLHSRGIIHRDLKPENILIDSDGHIKIADFGLAVEGVFGDETTTGYAGTRDYMAPEVYNGGEYDSTVDFWSLGVILHEMLTGRKPTISWWTNNLKCPANLSPEEKDILNMLLCHDPIKRLDFVQYIKDHPFFESTDWLALEGGTTELPVTTPPEENKSSFSSGRDPYEGLNFVCQEWMNKH